MKFKAPYGSSDPNAPYVDKDVPGAVAGSKVPRQAVEDPQRELDALIAKSGLTPSHDDLTQVSKAVRSQRLNYRVATGTANALTIALDPAPADWADLIGVPLRVQIAATNTGAATLAVTGLTGTKPIRRFGGAALVASDMPVGGIVTMHYDGTNVQLSALTQVGQSGLAVYDTAGSFTWTPPAGVFRVRARVWGGGGGGGGSLNNFSAATGGGGGGYSEGFFNVTPGVGVTVIVGAAGAAGASGGGNGGNGGTSSFGAHNSATGGGGGSGASSGTSLSALELRQDAGAGGIGSGGQINRNGQYGNGTYATPAGSGPALNLVGGVGGASFEGGGSRITVAGVGAAGDFQGDGGGGASIAGVGGAGKPGRVEIYY